MDEIGRGYSNFVGLRAKLRQAGVFSPEGSNWSVTQLFYYDALLPSPSCYCFPSCPAFRMRVGSKVLVTRKVLLWQRILHCIYLQNFRSTHNSGMISCPLSPLTRMRPIGPRSPILLPSGLCINLCLPRDLHRKHNKRKQGARGRDRYVEKGRSDGGHASELGRGGINLLSCAMRREGKNTVEPAATDNLLPNHTMPSVSDGH